MLAYRWLYGRWSFQDGSHNIRSAVIPWRDAVIFSWNLWHIYTHSWKYLCSCFYSFVCSSNFHFFIWATSRENLFLPYANNKGADQPLISAFVIHCLDSIISVVSICKISSLLLISVAEQASLSLTWSEIPKTHFRVMWLIWRVVHFSHLMTKPTKWHVRPSKTQISLGICAVWSESSLSAWRNIGSSAACWVHRKDSDQTGLIWVSTGRTCHFIGFVMRWLISITDGCY